MVDSNPQEPQQSWGSLAKSLHDTYHTNAVFANGEGFFVPPFLHGREIKQILKHGEVYFFVGVNDKVYRSDDNNVREIFSTPARQILYLRNTITAGLLVVTETNELHHYSFQTWKQILPHKQIKQLYGGQGFIVIQTDTEYFGLGENRICQLPDSPKCTFSEPLPLTALDTKQITSFSVGGYHTMFISNGVPYGYGYNRANRIYSADTGASEFISTPRPLQFPEMQPQIISCGKYHTLVVSDKQELFSWGYSTVWNGGATAQGQIYDIRKVSKFNDMSVKRVFTDASATHSWVLMEDGDLWSFGDNNKAIGHKSAGQVAKMLNEKEIGTILRVCVCKNFSCIITAIDRLEIKTQSFQDVSVLTN